MSKRQTLMLLGALMMALLFLGFPSAWDKLFALALGAAVIGVAYALGSSRGSAPSAPTASVSARGAVEMPFVEHRADPIAPAQPAVEPSAPASADPLSPTTL